MFTSLIYLIDSCSTHLHMEHLMAHLLKILLYNKILVLALGFSDVWKNLRLSLQNKHIFWIQNEVYKYPSLCF